MDPHTIYPLLKSLWQNHFTRAAMGAVLPGISLFLLFTMPEYDFQGYGVREKILNFRGVVFTVIALCLISIIIGLLIILSSKDAPKKINFTVFITIVSILTIPALYSSIYLYFEIRSYLNHTVSDCITGLSLQSPIQDYVYFSYTTLTTLGYGDWKPDLACRLVTSSQAVIGYFLLALVSAIIFRWIQPIFHEDD